LLLLLLLLLLLKNRLFMRGQVQKKELSDVEKNKMYKYTKSSNFFFIMYKRVSPRERERGNQKLTLCYICDYTQAHPLYKKKMSRVK
jgi:hypothetical protein